MADTMTCPACRQQHPTGTTWCPVMYVDITRLREEPVPPPADPTPDPVASPARAREAESGPDECPNCGALGHLGQPCPQCLEVIPRRVAHSLASQVFIVLPSFRGVEIPRGQEVVIGRQSDVREIREGLEAFDGVSRQHCLITVDADRDIATIRDPHSMNRTWVGDDEREIGTDERRLAPLPTRIRLGQTAYLTITTEGAR